MRGPSSQNDGTPACDEFPGAPVMAAIVLSAAESEDGFGLLLITTAATKGARMFIAFGSFG